MQKTFSLALALAIALASTFGFIKPAEASISKIEFVDSAGTVITSFKIGDPLFVQVTDANRNANAAAVETVQATVSATTSGDSEALTTATSSLTETGANTGIFRNAGVPTALKDGTVAQNDGTLEIEQTDTLNASYTDPSGEAALFDFSNTPLAHTGREGGYVDDGSSADDPTATSCADSAVYAGDSAAIDPNVTTNGGYIPVDRTKWDLPPSSVAGENNDFTTTNVSSENGTRERNKSIGNNPSFPGCHGWDIHDFEMKLSPFTATTLSSLDIRWRGVATRVDPFEAASLNDAMMLILNRTSGQWQLLDTEANNAQTDSTPFTNITLSSVLTTGFTNYVDSNGIIRVIVAEYTLSTDANGGGLYTDYFSVNALGNDTSTATLALTGGSIFGTVWNDKDRDGVFDSSEVGIASVKVALLDDTGTVLVTDTTNQDGDYGFIAFPAGTYSLRETDPAGFVSTTPNTLGPITLAGGQVVTEQNFGDAQQLSTTGLLQRYTISTFLVMFMSGLLLWYGVPRIAARRLARVPSSKPRNPFSLN
jgi:hypothetical protein